MKRVIYNFNLVVKKLLAVRRIKDVLVDVFVVSNVEMNEIKKRLVDLPHFRGAEAEKIKKEEMVNVLSFPPSLSFPHESGKKKSLGEIYLNYDFASGDRGELTRLLIHGFLHLLDYRHRIGRDRIKMEREEKRLFGIISK